MKQIFASCASSSFRIIKVFLPVTKRAVAFCVVALLFVAVSFAFLLMPVVVTEAMFITAGFFDRVLRWATIKIGDDIAGPFILSLSLLIGVIAFFVREKLRLLYAIIELFFGIYGTAVALAALYASSRLPPAIVKLIDLNNFYQLYVGLGSGIYIIVRGMDNLAKGLMEAGSWTDRVAKRFRKKDVDAVVVKAPESTFVPANINKYTPNIFVFCSVLMLFVACCRAWKQSRRRCVRLTARL